MSLRAPFLILVMAGLFLWNVWSVLMGMGNIKIPRCEHRVNRKYDLSSRIQFGVQTQLPWKHFQQIPQQKIDGVYYTTYVNGKW